MSCAWWLGVQVPRAVPASGYVRAAAGSTPSSHRSPGTLEHLFMEARYGVWAIVCSATNFHLGSEPPRARIHSGKAHLLFPRL